MMSVEDASHRASLRRRVLSLTPDSPRRWGAMTVDQMLWHVNVAMEGALGRRTVAPVRPPIPAPILKFLVFNLPWPKNAPTAPDMLARDRHDFAEQRERCLTLVEAMAGQPASGRWESHPAFGKLTSKQWSRLTAMHLDHHLRQFGA